MKTRWKTLCSLASVVTLAGAAVGNPDGISAKAEKFFIYTDMESTLPGTLSGRGDRQLPNPGGGCQLLYGDNHNNATSFEAMDDFHPTTTGNITRITFAGVYRKGRGTGPAPFAGALPPGLEPGITGTESFEITVYEMDTGPGSGDNFAVGVPLGAATDIYPPRISRQSVSGAQLNRLDDGTTVQNGASIAKIWTYDVTLPTPIAVDSTKCYYLQIRAVCNPNFDGSFTNNSSPVPGYSWRWMQAAPGQGNGRAIQQASTNDPGPAGVACPAPNSSNGGAAQIITPTLTAADFAFCLNIGFDRASPCKQSTSCVQAVANCQNHANGNNNRFSFAAGAKSADNFVVTANQNVTSMCWTGFYSNQVLVPADDSFTINIYNNNTAPCGTLGTFSFPTGSPIATRNVSPAASGNEGQTKVGPARFNGPPIGYLNFFEWNVAFTTPIALTPGCYWVEIISNSTTGWAWLSNYGDPQSQVRKGGDEYFHQHPNAGTYGIGTRVSGFDLAFCIGFSINPINNACPPGPAPANSTCLTAQALTIGGAAVAGFDTVTGGGVDSGGNQLPPAFGSVIDNDGTGGVWYTVNSASNQNITLSTCNTGTAPCAGVPAGTDHDTAIAVYCATSCAGPFKSVAYNDDQLGTACASNVATASTVTFPAIANQTYYVYVFRQGFSGFFYVNAVGSAVGQITPSTCASINEPPAPIAANPAGATAEPEACGIGSIATAPGESCQTAYAAVVGTYYCGTLDSSPTTFDDDWYKYPDLAENTFYTVELLTETPINIFVFSGGPTTCPATGAPAAAAQVAGFTIFPNNVTGNAVFEFTGVPGQLYVALQPTAFDGMACSTNRNKYCLRITASTVGSCCIQSGSGCTVTSLADCSDTAVNPGGVFVGAAACFPADCDENTGNPVAPAGACCVSDGGCLQTTQVGCTSPSIWQGAGTTCTANPCNTAALAAAQCCYANQSCAILNSSACTSSGGTYNFNKACLPNTCASTPTTGRCCIGARCATGVSSAQCTASGSAGASFTVGASGCNAPGVFSTPCCFANYNKVGGITVQDIFDFLAGWFANSPNANVQGDGTALPGVQDIFDFLAAWFAGGCT